MKIHYLQVFLAAVSLYKIMGIWVNSSQNYALFIKIYALLHVVLVFPLVFLSVICSCHLIEFKLFAKLHATLTFLKRKRNSDHHRMKEKEIFSILWAGVLFTVDPLRMFSFDCLMSLQLKTLLRYITLVMNTLNTVIAGSTQSLHAFVGLS